MKSAEVVNLARPELAYKLCNRVHTLHNVCLLYSVYPSKKLVNTGFSGPLPPSPPPSSSYTWSPHSYISCVIGGKITSHLWETGEPHIIIVVVILIVLKESAYEISGIYVSVAHPEPPSFFWLEPEQIKGAALAFDKPTITVNY